MSTPLQTSDMRYKPRILALIPARGGSKRLPGKNIRILGDKPLIAWTISSALQSGSFCDVLVSTDDQEIANIARQWGALVPWLRPPELATDVASSVDVALHALDWYEENYCKLDGIVFLQPTSPFRSLKTLQESLDLFLSIDEKPVVSVAPALSHPAWCFRIYQNTLIPFLGWEEANKRSQDLEPAFVTDGSVYITSPTLLRFRRSFIGDDVLPYVITNPDEVLDIDTLEDWKIAEELVQRQVI
jgi:N-acylneuraminate cytidylyltransferase/CMP-N,N'-diacetyllegionaminic acid synthase